MLMKHIGTVLKCHFRTAAADIIESFLLKVIASWTELDCDRLEFQKSQEINLKYLKI